MAKSNALRRRLGVISVIAGSLVLASFGPALYSLAWYSLHQHQITYKGKIMNIPRGWITEGNDGSGGDITFRKLPLNVFSEQRYDWIMLAGASGTEPNDRRKNWQFRVTKLYSPPAFQDIRTQDVKIGSHEASCISADVTGGSQTRSVSCVLVQDGLTVEFSGIPLRVATFFEVIRQIR